MDEGQCAEVGKVRWSCPGGARGAGGVQRFQPAKGETFDSDDEDEDDVRQTMTRHGRDV